MLLVIAGLGIWAWFEYKGALRAWTPNIVVGAIAAAVTITIIDWAVRQEAKQRLQPEIDDVLAAMGRDLRDLLASIVLDYAGMAEDSRQIPADGLELLDLWRSTADGGGRSDSPILLTRSGTEFAERLEIHRRRDRDAIPLELRRAIDRYQERAEVAARLFDQEDVPANIQRESLRQLVAEARDWYRVFLDQGGQPVSVADAFRDIAQRFVSRHEGGREHQ